MQGFPSKASFRKFCSRVGGEHLAEEHAASVLAGFKQLYPRSSHKRAAVDAAVGVTWKRDATRRSGCFVLLGPQGETTTVSASCAPPSMSCDINQACRGAVHATQIMPRRTRQGTEIDHCNAGGMKALIRAWRDLEGLSDAEMHAFVVRSDVLDPAAARHGFYTFREPVLSRWRQYHAQHAQLQELAADEHKTITAARRRN